MTAKIFAMTCGHLNGPLGHLMDGAGDHNVDLPIPSFLIEHPKGRAPSDTAIHPDLRTIPASRIRELPPTLIDPRVFGPTDDVKSKLDSIDRDPAGIDFI